MGFQNNRFERACLDYAQASEIAPAKTRPPEVIKAFALITSGSDYSRVMMYTPSLNFASIEERKAS